MKKFCALLFGTLLLTITVSAFTKKSRVHQEIEIINDFVPGSHVETNMRIENISEIPRAIYSPNYHVERSDPESMAREYLLNHTEMLHHSSEKSVLKFVHTTETPAGYRVQFIQEFEGYPVYSASIKISLNRNNEVVFVMNGYQNLGIINSEIRVSGSEALFIAENHLGIKSPHTYENVETIIYRKDFFEAIVVQKVTLVPRTKLYGDWEILIDALSGEIVRVEDKACYYDHRETGPAWVYDPDPITAARTLYGQPQFSDNGDQNSDSLNAYLKQVDLEGLSLTNDEYYLSGPYASIIDAEGPFSGLYGQDTLDFRFTRNQPEFEVVNIYYHINKSMAYLNDSLGFDVMPHQYQGGVQFDPHGVNGEVNAHYLSSSGYVAFGSPNDNVDAGEDHSIIWHELGHGIHDWITHGGLSQVDGLSEGLSDYWAQSYTRSLGLLTPEDQQYDYFSQWGLQPYGAPSLRVTNFPNHYPEGLGGEVHYDGQLWSSSLMSIYDLIGRQASDTDCWEGISMTDRNSNQVDAAFAFIQADMDTYDGMNLDNIVPIFIARGYLPDPVMALFDADITAGIDSIVTNFEDFSFAYPGPITSWEWDFNNDGITDATEQNPQHTYIGEGAYSVSLVVSDGTNSDTLLLRDFISLNSGTLVYDGQAASLGVSDYSGHFISDKLDKIGIANRYTNKLPSSLIGFDAVFMSLGNIGENGDRGTFLNDTQMNTIIEYVSSGGNIYIEGGTFWGVMEIFSFPDRQLARDLFSIENTSIDFSEQVLSQLLGQDNSVGANISFNSSTQSNHWHIDHFTPKVSGMIGFIEPTYGNVAIQGSGEYGQKTFYMSYSLAELIDGDSRNTREEVLVNIVEYFELPYLSPGYLTSANSGHAPLTVDFLDISRASPGIESWQWDFNSDGIVDSEDQYAYWTYSEPGIYSVTLTIGNSETSASILMENDITIFDGESALNFNANDNAVIVESGPLLNMTDALTMEAWIYPTGWGNQDAGEGRIVDKGFIRFFLNKQGSSQFADSSLGLMLKHQDGTLSKVGTSPNSIHLNEWQHVAMTYDATTSEAHLFINGIDRTEVDTEPSGPIMNHSVWDLYIGNSLTRSSAFDGRLDELRIWNVAVPQSDLISEMSGYLNGDEVGLMAYFRMNEAYGDSLYDITANSHRGIIENATWEWGTNFVLPVSIDAEPALPIERLVMENYPNPFNPSTSIRYGLPSQTSIELQIFDVRGVELQNISIAQQAAGWHELEWNGMDRYGSRAPSGIYFCRIQTDHDYRTVKMLMLK